MRAVALTVAGSDPSGGAGLQGDLATFHQHGVYGCAVVTLVTVQNTTRLSEVRVLEGSLVAAQLEAVLQDIRPGAAKTAALGSLEVVRTVARGLTDSRVPLVVDPVRVAKHGASLIGNDARAALIDELLPLASLVTPNAEEAAWLAERPVRDETSALAAGQRLVQLGARGVLLKGGHLTIDQAVDFLFLGGEVHRLTAPRLPAGHTHGVGCALAAAITAQLALGAPLLTACQRAKEWITRAIASAPGLGRGNGPVNHFAPVHDPD